MVWTQEEEEKYLKSPYKQYSIGLEYTVWVDVDAKDESEAIDKACNANYSLNVYIGKNHPRVAVSSHAELNEYSDPKVWCEDD